MIFMCIFKPGTNKLPCEYCPADAEACLQSTTLAHVQATTDAEIYTVPLLGIF